MKNHWYKTPSALKLISASGRGNIRLLLLHLLGGLPVECLQSLRENGVREVVAGKHPVGIHGAEVLDLKFDQRAGKLGIVAEVVGKGIGLELEAAAQDIHEELNHVIGGTEDIRKQEEAHDDGVFLVETEVGIERLVVDKHREEGKDVEEMGLIELVNK